MSELRPTSWAFIGTVGNVTACTTDSIWLFPPCTAPDAAPTNVSTSSTLLNQIDVSWSPPPEEFQNGVIIRYLVHYADIAAPSMVTVQTATTTSASLTMAISAGTTYLVSIAAVTSVGDGPFSSNVAQQTLSLPPPFPEVPSQSPDMAVTSTTIPITLPTIPSLQEYRYTHIYLIPCQLVLCLLLFVF